MIWALCLFKNSTVDKILSTWHIYTMKYGVQHTQQHPAHMHNGAWRHIIQPVYALKLEQNWRHSLIAAEKLIHCHKCMRSATTKRLASATKASRIWVKTARPAEPKTCVGGAAPASGIKYWLFIDTWSRVESSKSKLLLHRSVVHVN